MVIMRHPRFKPHNLLRAWAILWLIAIPLFHIHPEIDPHHGQGGHIHSGTVHTVFSGDLDGEFGHHHDMAEDSIVPDSSGWLLSAESPHGWKADPELGFSLLNDSSDRKLFKSLSTAILFVVHPIAPVPIRRDLLEQGGPSALFSVLFVSKIPARAPPSPLLV